MADHDDTRPLDPDLTRTAAGAPASGPERLPDRIGRYRPLRVIGQGGMGVVYEAEQDEPRRRVALKVIRSEVVTESLRRRFAHESIFLARLQHPGIAQVYESGTAETPDGATPFIAMELVDGVPLDRWVHIQEPDRRARIELMIQLCDAVQHAHQRGLIHRDLKPGNVLVDAGGRVRVLDFGVARPRDPDFEASLVTTHGELVGTLAYMSPEQLGADPEDIDTRSDIYALGMIFYELMAGARPFELGGRSLPEMIRIMREEEPALLGRLDAKLAGDLELIAATAMAKDRTQRYASANGLGMDLRRYLGDQPISARPPSTVYQLKKFARRHRPLVIGGAGIAVALVLGVLVSSWQAVRATRAEQLAETRREQAESVNDFLQDMLAAVQPEEAQGREVTVREVLDRAARDLDGGGLARQPRVEMALRHTLGTTYRSLGQYDASLHILERGRALADSLLPAGSPEIQQLSIDLAYTEKHRGDIDATEELIRSQLDRIPPVSELRIDALTGLADVAYTRGGWQEADSLQALAEETAIALAQPDSLALAWVLLDRAFLAEQRNELDRALGYVVRTEAIFRARYGDQDARMISVLNRKGDIARTAGRYQDAIADFEESLAITDVVYPPRHPMRANVLWRRGMSLMASEELDQATADFEEALSIRRETLGPNHRDIALSLESLSSVEMRRGDLDAAERHAREGYEMRRKIFGDHHAAVAASLQGLAHVARARGDIAEAESLYVQVYDLLQSIPEHSLDFEAGNAFFTAMLIQQQGDHARAEKWFRRALEVTREAHGEEHPLVARAYSNLATNLFRQGRKDEAADVQGIALQMQRRFGEPNESLLLAIGNVAYLLDDAGRYAEADSLHREYIALSGRIYGDQHAGAADARTRYCRNLIARGLWDEAQAQADSLIAWRESHLEEDDYRRRTARIYSAMVDVGRGNAEQADGILTGLESYLAGAEGIEPRRRERIEALVAQVRSDVDSALGKR